jgi:hypothetical protein
MKAWELALATVTPEDFSLPGYANAHSDDSDNEKDWSLIRERARRKPIPFVDDRAKEAKSDEDSPLGSESDDFCHGSRSISSSD